MNIVRETWCCKIYRQLSYLNTSTVLSAWKILMNL